MTVAALCRKLGISRSAYYCRIRRGWEPHHVTGLPRYQRRPRPDTGTGQDVSRVLREWRR